MKKILVSLLHISSLSPAKQIASCKLIDYRTSEVMTDMLKWIHTDMPEDDEVSISLSVGDGRYLVDLGRYVVIINSHNQG